MKYILPVAILFFSVAQVSGQEWFNTTSGIPQPSVAFEDYYGKSTSMEGNVTAVGAPQSDESNLNSGKVFIYEKSGGTWQLTRELFSETSGEDEHFGSVVLLKDGFLFVGAPGMDFNGIQSAGGVFVYKKIDGTWTYLNTITANETTKPAVLGVSIAFNGNLLAIGAGFPSIGGAVYIYDDPISPSSQVARIVPEPTDIPSQFGMSVTINSTSLFIADPFCNNGQGYGAVYVYDLNYARQAKLTCSAIDTYNFGQSISATETSLAVGSPYVSNPDQSYGAVFIFEKPQGGWADAIEDVQLSPVFSDDYGLYGQSVQLSANSLIVGSDGGTALDFYEKPSGGWSASAEKFTLREPDLTYVDRYAYSFATNGTDVFVGAYNLNRPYESSGAVYVYGKTGTQWSSLEQTGLLADPSISASASAFGYDVALDGKFAVIGSPFDDEIGKDAGAAYVFKLEGNAWQRIAKLTASDGLKEHQFGHSVAISGEMIVISAPNADMFSNANNQHVAGKVYIFQKPNGGDWVDGHETEVIERIEDSVPGDFGHQVEVANNLVAVSQFGGGSSDEIGKVYLLQKVSASWEVKAVLSPTPETVRLFGAEIAFDEKCVVVTGAKTGGFLPGSVLIFEKPAIGWVNSTQTAMLSPSDPMMIDGFGTSIAIDDGTILVGATQISPVGFTGAAYVFEKTGDHWINSTETIKLLPEGEAAGSKFGSSVALSGHFAAVGSSTVNSGNGKVLLYRQTDDQWESTPYASLELPSSGGTNQFGYSLDMEGDHVVIGAQGTSTLSGAGSGSAEFYMKQPSVTQVTSTTRDGVYGVNDLINVKVTYSHPIVVTGSPVIQVALENSIVQAAPFKNISNGNEVNFEYKVHKTDFSDDLDYTTIDAITVPGGSSIKSGITDHDSYNTLPGPGTTNSLAGSKSIVVNGEIVGITEYPDSDIKVYPNPCKDHVHVSGNTIQSVELLNSNGVSVFTSSQNFEEILTAHLPTGVYILKIRTEEDLVFRRIVKH